MARLISGNVADLPDDFFVDDPELGIKAPDSGNIANFPPNFFSPTDTPTKTVVHEESGKAFELPDHLDYKQMDYLIKTEHDGIQPTDFFSGTFLGRDPVGQLLRGGARSALDIVPEMTAGAIAALGGSLKEAQKDAAQESAIRNEFDGKTYRDLFRKKYLNWFKESNLPDFVIGEGARVRDVANSFYDAVGISRKENDGFAYDIGSGFGSVGVSAATQVVTKSAAAATFVFGALQASSVYQEAISSGKTHDEAMQIAGLSGVVEGVFEKFGGDKIVHSLFSSQRLGKFWHGAARVLARSSVEGAQEFGQTGAEEIITQASGTRKFDPIAGITRTLQAAGIGFLVGVPIHGVTEIATKEGKSHGLSDKEIQDVVDYLKDNQDEIIETARSDFKNASSPLYDASDVEKKRIEGVLEQFKRGESITSVVPNNQVEQDLKDALDEAVKQSNAAHEVRKKVVKAKKERSAAQIEAAKKNLKRKPMSLSGLVRSLGGITDEGGDLKSQDSKLVKKNGMSPDAVLKVAIERGYFPQPDPNSPTDISINDLYTALDDEANGVMHYAASDMGAAVGEAEKAQAREYETEQAHYMDMAREDAKEFGLELNDDEARRWAELRLTDLSQSDIALHIQDVRDGHFDRIVGGLYQEEQPVDEIPFDVPATPAIDKTAVGDQTVIRGAEKISDRQYAERKMAEPMRGKVPQQKANEGIFDLDGQRQQDIFAGQKNTGRQPDFGTETKQEKHERVFVNKREGSHPIVEEKNRAADFINGLSDKDYQTVVSNIAARNGFGNPDSFIGNITNADEEIAKWKELIESKGSGGGVSGEASVLPEKSSKVPQDRDQLTHTSRRSYSNDIWTDAGRNADDVARMPLRERMSIAASMMKSKFGIDVRMGKKGLMRHAVDNLADLYVGLKAMSNATGIAPKVMGLNHIKLNEDGTQTTTGLTVVFRGEMAALGVYKPDSNEIHTPTRANSFVHEWTHARDYAILRSLGETVSEIGHKFRGMSGRIRKSGIENYEPASVEEAFINLTNTLFFDDAYPAVVLMQLEKKLDNAKTDKGKGAIQEQIDNIKSGKWQGKKHKSPYFRDAKSLPTGSDKGYWTRPTEMLARAYEAMIADRFHAAGIPTDIMTFGHDAYDPNNNEFNKLYPQGADRDRIFLALQQLDDALNKAQMFNTGNVSAEKLEIGERIDVLDIAKRVGETPKIPLMQELKDNFAEIKEGLQRTVAGMEGEEVDGARPKDPVSWLQKAHTAYSQVLDANIDTLHILINRNPVTQKSLKLFKNIGKVAGLADQSHTTFFLERRRIQTKYMNRIGMALDVFSNGKPLKRSEEKVLRDFFFNHDRKPQTPREEQLQAIATELNRINIDLRYEIERLFKANGVKFDLGEVTDDVYLRRYYDKAVIHAKKNEFLDAAVKSYLAKYGHPDFVDSKFSATERDIGSPDNANLKNFIELAEAVGMKKDTRVKEMGKSLEDQEDGEEDVRGEIDPELYNEVLMKAARISADAWWGAAVSGGAGQYQTTGTPSGFMKRRVMPPETDRIMEDFLVGNPIEAMDRTISSIADYTAWKTLIEKEPDYLGKAKEEMVNAGWRPKDADMFMAIIQDAAGKSARSHGDSSINAIVNPIRAVTTAMLMKGSVISSLSEPFAASIVTGDIKTSWRVLGNMTQLALKNGTAKDKARMGQMLGVLEHRMSSLITADRMGGTYEDSPRLQKFMQNFYENNALSKLTRLQRESVFLTMPETIKGFLEDALDQTLPKARQQISGHQLYAWGLPKGQLGAFSKYLSSLKDGIPSAEALNNPSDMDMIYTNMIGNAVNEIIQSPSEIDVPHLANNPFGRWSYALTRFTFGFWGNVYEAANRKSASYAEYVASDKPWYVREAHAFTYFAHKFLPTIMQYYLATSLVYLLRTLIFNGDKWDDADDEEKFKMIALGGLAYTTPAGIVGDVLLNAASSIKYNRDITQSLTPPSASVPLGWLQSTINYFFKNTKGTNTQERAMVKSLYDIAVTMPLTIATGLLPQPIGYVGAVGLNVAGSRQAKEAAATSIAGEEKKKKKRD